MATLTFPAWFAGQHPQIPFAGAQAILALAEGGATVPFIARYRKEQTGNLDEVAIRQELEARIRGTFDETVLEDIYLPYKQKRKTKAQTAREAGLEPLADWLWAAAHGEVDAGAET